MTNVDPLDKYEVESPLGEAAANYPTVYEIPIGANVCDIESSLPAFCVDCLRDPETAWSQRLDLFQSADPEMRMLRTEFCKYMPRGIVLAGDQAWWMLINPDIADTTDWCLLGIAQALAIDSTVTLEEFSSSARITRLFSSLFGFREDYPPSGGYVCDLLSDDRLLTEDYVRGCFGTFSLVPDWNPCLRFFNARNGDLMVINRRGQFGWWEPVSASAIRLFAESIELFVEKLISFRQSARLQHIEGRHPASWPFDSFGLRRLKNI